VTRVPTAINPGDSALATVRAIDTGTVPILLGLDEKPYLATALAA
jgi:hypothetical protein